MGSGKIGVSLGGSMEYRYSLSPNAKNCKNCKYYQQSDNAYPTHRKQGYCSHFKILISDPTNGKLCIAFFNKHTSAKKLQHKTQKRKTPQKGA